MTGEESMETGRNFAISTLIGTCTETVPEDASHSFLEGVDEVAFQCDDCGWWCDVSEESEESQARVCQECYDGRG